MRHLITFLSFTTYFVLCFSLAILLNSCEKPQLITEPLETLTEPTDAIYFDSLDFSTGAAVIETDSIDLYILSDKRTVITERYKNNRRWRVMPYAIDSLGEYTDYRDSYEYVDVMRGQPFNIGDDFLSYVEPRELTDKYIVL